MNGTRLNRLHVLPGTGWDEEFGAIPAVEIHSVDVRGTHDLILHDINLSIRDGDCFGIIGPFGGGKSILLRTLLGLVPIQEGSLRLFDSRPTPRLRKRLPVGYLPQFSPLADETPATVWEYVCMGTLGSRGLFRSMRKETALYVENVLTALHLDHCLRMPVGHLSPGQQQRIRIARALAPLPRFLVLDEPFQSLDPPGQEVVIRLLADLRRRNHATIVIAAQNGKPLAPVCKHIACLNQSILWIAARRDIDEEVWADPCRNFPWQDREEEEETELERYSGRPAGRSQPISTSHPIQFWR